MFTHEKKLKAIRLYIKNGLRAAPTIQALGYPSRKMLKQWYLIYASTGDAPDQKLGRQKFSDAQRRAAVDVNSGLRVPVFNGFTVPLFLGFYRVNDPDFHPVFHPVRVSFETEYMSMMQEAVQRGSGNGFVIENFRPVSE
jgi:hypothetical protein